MFYEHEEINKAAGNLLWDFLNFVDNILKAEWFTFGLALKTLTMRHFFFTLSIKKVNLYFMHNHNLQKMKLSNCVEKHTNMSRLFRHIKLIIKLN